MGSSCDGICDRQVRGSSQYLRAPGPVEGSAPSWWTPGRATPHPNPRSAVALSVLAAFHPPAWPLLTPQRRQHQDRELPAWAPHPALYGLSGLGCCPRWDPGFAVVIPLPPDQKGADQAPAAKVPPDLDRPLAAGCFQPRGQEAGPPCRMGPAEGRGAGSSHSRSHGTLVQASRPYVGFSGSRKTTRARVAPVVVAGEVEGH